MLFSWNHPNVVFSRSLFQWVWGKGYSIITCITFLKFFFYFFFWADWCCFCIVVLPLLPNNFCFHFTLGNTWCCMPFQLLVETSKQRQQQQRNSIVEPLENIVVCCLLSSSFFLFSCFICKCYYFWQIDEPLLEQRLGETAKLYYNNFSKDCRK